VGQEINANHVRAARSGLVTGTARPVHMGGRTHVWTIDIVNEAGKAWSASRASPWRSSSAACPSLRRGVHAINLRWHLQPNWRIVRAMKQTTVTDSGAWIRASPDGSSFAPRLLAQPPTGAPNAARIDNWPAARRPLPPPTPIKSAICSA
jgi:hypothetical protein